MKVFRQFLTLAANTALDILRQPVILLLVAACIVLIGILPLMVMFTFGEEERLVRDGALAFQFVFGLLICGTAAAFALYKEVTGGGAALVLCKPVGRATFFLAKYTGVLAILLVFSSLALIAALFSVRLAMFGVREDWRGALLFFASVPAAFALAAAVNYWFRRPFMSQTFWFMLVCLPAALLIAAGIDPGGHVCRFGAFLQWKLVPAMSLIALAVAVLAAIALALSTRLPPVQSLTACGMVFILGLLSDYLLAQASLHSFWAALGYGLLPNWQDFWLADALAGMGTIPWDYVRQAGVYAALYTAGVLCLGLLSFRNVEIQ